jgi:uncharacterized protein (TIGR03000 family)
MYSMVLMMALTGGVDTIDSHRNGGGCYGGGYGYGGGCMGAAYAGGCSGWLASSGYGCNGGYGYGCHGGGGHGRLFGGGCHGGRGGLFAGHRNRGCQGGGYGCNGGYGYGCHGGGYGCYGGGYGAGCYGRGVVVGGGCYGTPAVTPAVTPGGGEMKKEEKIGAPVEEKKGVMNIAAPATILVSLPADARLTVDGMPTTSTSDMRAFATPILQPGHQYSYMLRAEITRDGQTIQTEQRVPVSAGQTSRVNMTFPATTTTVAGR